MNSSDSNPSKIDDNNTRYRVMVVDDSAVIRGFICRYLSADASIDVVTTANNGAAALRQLAHHDIEVVVLDIEMPEMDGMTALPKMIEMKPGLQVIMASTLTRKNAEISMRALQKGAMDYVPKPETTRSVSANIDFKRELVEKVKAWASRRRTKLGQSQPLILNNEAGPAAAQPKFVRPTRPNVANGFVSAKRPAASAGGLPQQGVTGASTAFATNTAPTTNKANGNAPIVLRKGSTLKPKILLIGSSTGGPQALMKFFAGFSQAPSVPVLITQHMPASFTSILADHLGQTTGWPSFEGKEGMEVKAGHIYVAPGGRHMEIVSKDGQLFIRITDDPPENFCRPAVDPLFRSAGKIFGERILSVILTGMGHDGLKGGHEITKAGATLLAQDEASSVVWGMPGAVAGAGLCTEVLPIMDLGVAAQKWLQGGMA